MTESEWINIDYFIFAHISAQCRECGHGISRKGKDTGWGYEYSLPMFCEGCGAKMKNGGEQE